MNSGNPRLFPKSKYLCYLFKGKKKIGEWGDGKQKMCPDKKEFQISNTEANREKSALHKCPPEPQQPSVHL